MLVVSGPQNPVLSKRLADQLGVPLARVETKRFPDGEAYARLTTPVRGQDVVVVQSTVSDGALVELLLIQDACRRSNARSVTTVIPYLGYARQDRVFVDGEAVSAEVVARIIERSTDRVLLVDPHRPAISHMFHVPCRAVTAVPAICDHLRNLGVEVVLAPDAGAAERAHEAAMFLKAKSDHLEKKRLTSTEVVMMPKEMAVDGRTVVILDDIISTGGTMVKAAGELKRQGAKKVVAACTHGLFIQDALPKLLSSGVDEVVATDTIEGQASLVSVASVVAKAL
ncbi:MAG TPA: ribose-phosphate diphosphokinase [Candidatus Thermoplasmatota archaeon]|nr:ribose-phosphate diphosphokinase [Candidatus Thermoplasmatota archaeon]